MKPKTFEVGKSYYCGKRILRVTARGISVSNGKAFIVLEGLVAAELDTDKDGNEEAKYFITPSVMSTIKAVDVVEE